MLVFTLLLTKMAMQLLLDQAIVLSGLRLANALQAKIAPGQPATRQRTDHGTQSSLKTKRHRPKLVQKAREKVRKVERKTKLDHLHRKPRSEEDPLAKEKGMAEAEPPLLLRMVIGLLPLLPPRSEASPLLAKPTGLRASDGLEALALTKNVSIGTPLPAAISKLEHARKAANANSCTILTRSKQPFRKPKLVREARASLHLSLMMTCLS